MDKLKAYLLLMKPGIVFGNAITCAGGLALASKGGWFPSLFVFTLLGLSLVVASGCVCNNFIDRHHDAKMERTKNRGLAKGIIPPKNALVFSVFLLIWGMYVLIWKVNILVLSLSLIGFIVYLIFYSFSKYRTVHATLIGSIAGAIPPVVGYCAISNRIDLGALLIFLMVAMWQMPHFYAIAMFRLKEYASASIPVLPLVRGMQATKWQMIWYILGFIFVSLLLVFCGYVGPLYLSIASLLGVTWLIFGIKGFKAKDDQQWARTMFYCSLAVVMGICFTIPFSVL